MDDQEYKLALDEQVGKFLDVRHKHTYFLVTAAIVVLAFVLNFAATNKLLSDLNPLALVIIIIGASSSLSVAGFALWSLSLDNASHNLHLKYRHLSKSWDEIPEVERNRWDAINQRAAKFRNVAFILLTVGVFANATFLAHQLYTKGGHVMHHYGKESTEIIQQIDQFEVVFTNKGTGQKIRMTIPKTGSRKDASEGLTADDVKDLSDQVNDVLRRTL
ncbi:MAG: hypothetical protein JW896_08205 [Deltaproteobacteria bacterium]|nr:hypothetical protein [Deltaproteobacteria bacterium]